MKIYDFSDTTSLNEDEKLIINMNAALLAFHTEDEILSFRNTHLNWLLFYDLKLDDQDYMHARMAYNAYADIVSVLPTISDEALHNLLTIASYCHGDVLMDLRHADVPALKAEYALHAGIRYIIGYHCKGLITCSYESVFQDSSTEEEI